MFFRAMTGENYAYQHEVNGRLGPSLMGIWHATIFQENAFLPEEVRQSMEDEGLASFRMDKNGAIEGRHNYADDYPDGTEIIQRIYSFGADRRLSNDWTLSGFVQYGKSEKENILENLLRVDREFLAMDAVEVYRQRVRALAPRWRLVLGRRQLPQGGHEQVGYPLEITSPGMPRNAPNLGIRGIAPGFTGGSPNLHQFSVLSTFAGDFEVWELFGETFVPLAKRLNLSLASGYSDYSATGPLVTWKVGFDSQLTRSFRFRATLSRDAREPSFQELFDFNGGGGTVDDPLRGNQSFSITVNPGGNPNLKAEEADTYTFGFVYQPQRLPGLAFSADYYNIDLSETIGSLGTQRIVDDCYIEHIQSECALIERDPATNTITRVSNVLVNIDNAKVSGTDIELTYQTEPDWFGNRPESLSLRFLAGYLGENSTTPLGGEKLDRAGSGEFPEWTGSRDAPSQAPQRENTAAAAQGGRRPKWSLRLGPLPLRRPFSRGSRQIRPCSQHDRLAARDHGVAAAEQLFGGLLTHRRVERHRLVELCPISERNGKDPVAAF